MGIGSFININPIALRMAKTLWSFGHSDCNRVKGDSDCNRVKATGCCISVCNYGHNNQTPMLYHT